MLVDSEDPSIYLSPDESMVKESDVFSAVFAPSNVRCGYAIMIARNAFFHLRKPLCSRREIAVKT